MENVLIGLFAADDGKPAARMQFSKRALTASNKVKKAMCDMKNVGFSLIFKVL